MIGFVLVWDPLYNAKVSPLSFILKKYYVDFKMTVRVLNEAITTENRSSYVRPSAVYLSGEHINSLS